MKYAKFKCKLLTDLIISQSAATEGGHKCLDFIPGNVFLGVVAGKIYNSSLPKEDAFHIFHSGKIKFGDAHPAYGEMRTLHVPASYYTPKILNENNKDLLLVHHSISNFQEYNTIQPKQSRKGFYYFDAASVQGIEVAVNKNFVIKSAYDKELRRSAESQLYSYQSMHKGLEMIFYVAAEEGHERLLDKIQEALISGTKRIGRSSTAQYGLVQIEFMDNSAPNVQSASQQNEIILYADSRLIFLDEYGIPSFEPTCKSLGLKEGKIDWTKSQIRTFQYAPWNFIRQARDTDRCGIEKGSVIVIENGKLEEDFNNFVGVYQNEGFGHVIVNPDFLSSKQDTNGKAKYILVKSEILPQHQFSNKEMPANDKLIQYLLSRKVEKETISQVYEVVNEFINDNQSLWSSKNDQQGFASQWGKIRSIAARINSKREFENALFGSDGYLVHGIAKEKWDKNNRREVLKRFMKEATSDTNIQSIIINLASEMAKKCGGQKK